MWAPEGVYLDTASYGLPPKPAWDALQAALEDWRAGRTSWEGWCEATERARGLFAQLVGVRPEQVAVGGGASPLVALLAGSLPEATRVLAPDVEFSSLLWPWVTRGADVRVAPLARLADAVDDRTDLVAVSAAQSATGEVADLDALCEAAAAHGALVVVDATATLLSYNGRPTGQGGAELRPDLATSLPSVSAGSGSGSLSSPPSR